MDTYFCVFIREAASETLVLKTRHRYWADSLMGEFNEAGYVTMLFTISADS